MPVQTVVHIMKNGLLTFLKLHACQVPCYLGASVMALWLSLNPKAKR